MKPTVVVCTGHSRPVVGIHFTKSPSINSETNLLLTSSHDRKALLRWADTGNWIGSFLGHSGAIWCATVDATTTRAATASGDFTAKLWSVESGKELATFEHNHVVKTVDFSPVNDFLLTGGMEKSAKVFDLGTGQLVRTLDHEGVGVTKALWLDHSLLLTGTSDGGVRQYDTREGGLVQSKLPIHAVSLISSFSSSTGGVGDSSSNTVSTKPGARSSSTIVSNVQQRGRCTDLEIVEGGAHFLASCGRRVCLMEASTMRPLAALDASYEVETVSLSRDKTALAAGGSDLHAHIYAVDPSTFAVQKEETHLLKGHHGPIFCARWDPLAGESL